MSDTYSLTAIRSEGLSALIHPLGAQLFALRDASDRELLWDGDPAVWNGRAPLLFPIVGNLVDNRYRLGDDTYRLPRHGFARNTVFDLVEATPAAARFRIRSDEKTLAVYPFHFSLEVSFVLEGAALTLSALVKNLGDSEMPASFGFHPALRWPLPFGQPRDQHSILFEADEPSAIRRLDDQGLIMPATFPSPVTQRRLVLRDELFLHDALIFDRIASRRVWYGAQTGPRLQVDFPDTPYLGIWTKPGAQFICIEPWHGYADPEGFSGDFRAKPGIFIVAPGQSRQCTMSITLCAD